MKRILTLVLAALLVLTALTALSGCSKEETPENVRVMVLSGSTGFGAANLMARSAAGNAELPYSFSVESDATVITAALINGSVDIAMLPTNAAAALYQKSEGDVQVIAVNTLGVLHLVTKDADFTGFADLAGKTLYVPSQGANPEYVTAALCEANGLTVGEDVTLDFTYNTPADLMTAVGAGLVDYAVLPEPMVTIALSKNGDYRAALDLTAEWDKVYTAGSLAQGCVVVRKDFAQSYPSAVSAFLAEYAESINDTIADPAAAGEQIAAQGIYAQAPIAAKAIPNCNLCCLTGEEMRTKLSAFYDILFALNPKAVGGKLPDEAFYFVAGN